MSMLKRTANLERQTKPRFYVGIDSGRQTGIAIYDTVKRKLVSIDLLDFWGTVYLLDNFEKKVLGDRDVLFPSDIIEPTFEVVIEDPNLNAPTFLPAGTPIKVGLNKAQKVGRVKEQTYLLMEFMKLKKIKFRTSRPTTQKWDAITFTRITKWSGSSNEHNRDAAKLVFGL